MYATKSGYAFQLIQQYMLTQSARVKCKTSFSIQTHLYDSSANESRNDDHRGMTHRLQSQFSFENDSWNCSFITIERDCD